MRSVETQTELMNQKLIKIESFDNIKLDRYYFDSEYKSIVTIRNCKRGEIRKTIKPTNTYGEKHIVVLRDSKNNPRTIDHTNLIKYCENLSR